MRVEAYTQVQQIYSSRKTEKGQQAAHISFADQLQISNAGKEYQAAKTAVLNTPDIREDIVAPLRSSLLSDTYKVSPEEFAEKLLKNDEEMR